MGEPKHDQGSEVMKDAVCVPENLASCFEEIRAGGRRGRAIYLYLHLLTHEQHLPDLEADLRMIFLQMPTDDQAILEFVIIELDACYNL